MKTILGVLTVIIVIIILSSTNYQLPTTNHLGVSFSPMYAKYLRLDYQQTYLSLLDHLKVRFLRIPTYWSEIEKQPGQFNFDIVDFMVREAEKRGAQMILVVGIKQPGWPECHIPNWARKLSISQRQQQALQVVEVTIKRYRHSPVVISWQVENEPFVSWFGENCDPPDHKFLQTEIELVRKLDPQRPIIITDSGEWSFWIAAMKAGDILGISLYRKAYNQNFGYITYPFSTWMYTLKSDLTRSFVALMAPQDDAKRQKTIIAELQAEVWTQTGVRDTPVDQQIKLFTVQDLKNNVEYAKKTGFSEIYLWGVEWWYYMASRGHPEYLDYAKAIFSYN